MFKEFPREVGAKRKIVKSEEEMLEWINNANGHKNCYTSVYKFNELTENRNGWMKPNYYSAEVDKAFFDYDIEEEDDRDDAYDNRKEALEALRRFHKWCKKKNIKHAMFISGGGFHSYVFTGYNVLEHKKHALNNAQWYIADECNLNIDETVFGDLAQITRIPNTYNLKRERFCIPLKPEEVMNKGPDELFELAESQRLDVNPIVEGKKLFLENFDYNKTKNLYKQKRKELKGIETKRADIEDCSIDINALNPPESIKWLINSDEKINHRQRYLLVTFFKAKGLNVEQCASVMQDILSDEKYYHCTNEEASRLKYGQISYLYDRDDVMFPNKETIKQQYGLPISGERSEEQKVYK